MEEIWTGVTTAPAPASTGGAVSDFWSSVVNLAGAKVNQETQRVSAQTQFAGDKTNPLYGVNDYGVPYLAGKPTFIGGSLLGVPAPLVLVGVGILALVILHGKG